MEKYKNKIYCSCCKKETNHYFLKTVKKGPEDYLSERELREISEGRNEIELQFEQTFNIGQCCGCDEINFFTTYHDEDYLRFNDYEDIVVFPPMPYYLKEGSEIHLRKFFLLPKNILKVVNEIRVSLCSDKPQPLLLTMGIRMILEATTQALKIEKGWKYEETEKKEYKPILKETGDKIESDSLHCKLYKMYEMEYISKSQFEILNKIKNHGNAATHDLTAPDYSVILKMYSVTEDVLYQQFELNRIGI